MRAFSSCWIPLILALGLLIPGCTLCTVKVCCEDACCRTAGGDDPDEAGELDSTALNWDFKDESNWYPTVTVTVNRLRSGGATPDSTLTHTWAVYGNIGGTSDICDYEWYPDEAYFIDGASESGEPKTKWVFDVKLGDMTVAPGEWVSLDVVVKPNRGMGSMHETRILHLCGQAPSSPPSAE